MLHKPRLIESDRLYLRAFEHSDIDNFYELDQDPEVMKYLDPVDADKSEYLVWIGKFIDRYEQYPGLGVWAAIDKLNDEWLGWFFLKPFDEKGTVELGYRLFKKYWNKGYTTEMCLEIIKHGFKIEGVDRIIAEILPGNIASKRVLEKIGMKYIENVIENGEEFCLFEIKKEEKS